MNSIKVRVPASTANLGPGFDTLGLALQVYNYVTIEESNSGDDEIAVFGEGASTLCSAPIEKNIAFLAARKLLEEIDAPQLPLRLTLENNVPLARGLGSSSAARVGALVAANEWAKLNGWKSVGQSTLLAMATRLEGHPDNVAPALLGGLVVSAVRESGEVLALQTPVNAFPRLVVFIPESELETEEARSILPDAVFLKDATFNIARSSLLIAALGSGQWERNPDLLREALRDKLHQDARASLMPAYECAVHAAMKAGALGATLSGAGPTILAWLPREEEVVAQTIIALQDGAASCEVFGNAREVLVDDEGCVVVAGD